jgi:outer membrane protein, heavy metal efflux system
MRIHSVSFGKLNIRTWNRVPGAMAVLGFLMIGALIPAGVRAADNAPLGVSEQSLPQTATLGDLVTYAYENNPGILEARKEWEAQIERYNIETGYPDPQLMFTYFPDPIETRLGPQDWNATISQNIPFPGKLGKAGDIVSAETRIAKFKLDKAVRDVAVGIRESFHELIYIRKAMQITKQNMDLLDHIRKVSETAHAQDRATLTDVIKAQSQTGQLRYDALLLEELEATETARLNGLLNRFPDTQLADFVPETSSPLAYSPEEMYRLAEEHQEEIQIAKAQIEKADAKFDLERYKGRPDFKLGVFYAGIGKPDVATQPEDAGRDAFGIQAGITLPLWIGKNKGRTARAAAEKAKAEAFKSRQVNTAHTNIRAVYFRLTNSRRLMELYRNELLPQAAQSMEIAETWFQEGESSFSDFVEAQAVWYNFQLALARAEADYGKYLARLERLVGQNLTQKQADLPEGQAEEEK